MAETRGEVTDKAPADCATMAELRREIDAIDQALIALLAQRSGYIDRAITLKQIENLPARTQDRVEEVVRNVRHSAQARGLDAALVEDLWRALIEWSIARERAALER